MPLASQGVQALDRYAYVNNNPLRYNDPSGHGISLPGAKDGLSRAKDRRPVIQSYITAGNDAAAEHNRSALSSYQNAINLAVEYYDIDTSDVRGEPYYDNNISVYVARAETYTNGEVAIGFGAFFSPDFTENASPGFLGAIIAHEAVHATQVAEGRPNMFDDGQGEWLAEYEANTWVINNATSFGLTGEETNFFIDYRDLVYSYMDDNTRALADQGIYILPTK